MFRYIVLFLLLLLSVASANLDAGEDVEVGDYVIDFRYSPEELQEGENALFVIELQDKETLEGVEATDMFVQLSKGNDLFFAGVLDVNDGPVDFSVLLYEGGEYDLEVRFENEGEMLVEHTFYFDVKKKDKTILTVVFIVLLALYFYLRFKKR
jgi:hypothetical protein